MQIIKKHEHLMRHIIIVFFLYFRYLIKLNKERKILENLFFPREEYSKREKYINSNVINLKSDAQTTIKFAVT